MLHQVRVCLGNAMHLCFSWNVPNITNKTTPTGRSNSIQSIVNPTPAPDSVPLDTMA
jgi:hypothetical protein